MQEIWFLKPEKMVECQQIELWDTLISSEQSLKFILHQSNYSNAKKIWKKAGIFYKSFLFRRNFKLQVFKKIIYIHTLACIDMYKYNIYCWN